jgi:outer membrane protein assembly factor BamB
MLLAAASCSASAGGGPARGSTRPRAAETAASSSGGFATSPVYWTVYHRYPGGSGEGPSDVDLKHLGTAWTSPALNGSSYGEPLVWGKDVYVATENDYVYALMASSGKVLWSKHLGTAVPQSRLVCAGDIGPNLGITGSPVIDTARNEIFVVADELVKNKVAHYIYGLDTATGKVEMHQDADPPGAEPNAILQRTSATLDDNRVVFGYGGNYGDCEPYHGWVESVPVTGGRAYFFEVSNRPNDSQGAVWMGGAAPIITSKGDVYVATGNGAYNSPSDRFDDSDAVLELSPTLKLLQYFAPYDWYSDNGNDYDLGSAVPAVVDGGVAFSGSTAYLPCEAGIVAVATNAAHDTIRQLWQTPTASGGPPILVGGYLWTISGQTLYALDVKNGDEVGHLPLPNPDTNDSETDFPTPSYGGGLLLAIFKDQVRAFRER